MAAPSTFLVRSVLLKGARLVTGQLKWTQTYQNTGPVCLQYKAAQFRPLHLTGQHLSSTKTEPDRGAIPQKTTDDKNVKEEEELYDAPEYIPRRRKAKNPMMKIGYAWMIGLPTGILAFILAKREVDKNRLKQLRVRQRMKRSNEGDYEGSRYQRAAEEVVRLDR